MKTALVCLVIILGMIHFVSPGKVLLLPLHHKAHIRFYIEAGRTLQQEGHQVLLLTQAYNLPIVKDSGIPYKLIKTSTPPIDETDIVYNFFFQSGFTYLRKFKEFGNFHTMTATALCYAITGDSDLMKELSDKKFDLAIVEGLDVARCYTVIPYKLGVKYLILTPRHDPWSAGLPAMPSGEGAFMFNYLPPDPSFLQRLKNGVIYTATYLMLPPIPNNQIQDMVPERGTGMTYRELYRKAEMILVNTDNTCFDTPRISAPHVQFIGGMSTHGAKPLPRDLEEFVTAAEHGLIVVSFGSLVNEMPDGLINKMLEVFNQLPQRVIFRYGGELKFKVEANVLVSKWIPQNDLLGHSKTKLFIGHGGNNGQMEALYHGVPMIVMPCALDQVYNAARVINRKFGLSLDALLFTADDLLASINEILTNPIYTANIRKCSAISRSFPSAQERMAFWVNHLIEFDGGDHLKPISVDLPLWKLFMFDVLLFWLVVGVVFAWMMCACCRCVVRKCRGKKEKTE